MESLAYENVEGIPDIREVWDLADSSARFHAGGYFEYREMESRPDTKVRIVVLRPKGRTPVVAPFTLCKGKKHFSIGERRLFSLDVALLSLYSQWLLQHAVDSEIKEIFRVTATYTDFDWLVLGEIPIDSQLYRGIRELGWPWLVSMRDRKHSLRWLIDLPPEFEEYLKRLSPRSRQSAVRKCRRFEKRYGRRVKVVTELEQVDDFLREAEAISRRTYQWNVGQRLCADEETRSRYEALVRRRKLRCYLLYADGRPCSFLRGTIEGDIYHYETPGFDPAFRSESVGTVLLMYAIRDLIENTSCKVFDFGTGGDDVGYKSTFGTRSLECVYVELGRRTSFYPVLIAGLQFLLNRFKDCAALMLRSGNLRSRVKRAIRKYGD